MERDLIHTVDGRLFQARIWRQSAMDWDRPWWDYRRQWVEHILKKSRAKCIQQARVNVKLARRLNKRKG